MAAATMCMHAGAVRTWMRVRPSQGRGKAKIDVQLAQAEGLRSLITIPRLTIEATQIT